MTDVCRNIETIFHHARQIADPAERASYLEEICGEDDTLRARVAALLAAEPEMRAFLEDVKPDVSG